MPTESTITLDISDRIATLTLNRPDSLNSLTAAGVCGTWTIRSALNGDYLMVTDYAYLSDTLREIDANEEVLVTILQGDFWFRILQCS